MALLLRGAPVAAVILERAGRDAAALKERGVVPALAIIRPGNRDDDITYERSILKRAEAAGVAVRCFSLPEDADQPTYLALIRRVNGDPAIHGVLIFHPLPPQLDGRIIRAALDPAKDIDGITYGSFAAIYAGERSVADGVSPGNADGGAAEGTAAGAKFAGSANGGAADGTAPCTAEACLAILDHYGIGVAGKRVTVIGRSLVIGRPVAMLFLQRDATVTVCHSKTADLPAASREAEIVVAALGKPEFLGAGYFRPGQVLIDVGIHAREDGSLCGDLRFAEAEPLATAISPVPGGVGAVTAAILLSHAVTAARLAIGKNRA